MDVDVMAPCVARSSTTMAMTTQDKRVLIPLEERFQLHLAPQCWEMMQMQTYKHIFMFAETISTWQGVAALITKSSKANYAKNNGALE